MKRCQILLKNIAKRLKRRHFPPSARETGKESNLVHRFSLLTVAPQERVAGKEPWERSWERIFSWQTRENHGNG